MKNEDKYDLIERYLSKDLDANQLKSFEQELQSDKSLQEEVELHRMAAETLKGEKVHELRSVLNKVDKDWKAPSASNSNNTFSLNFRKLAAVAAAVLLGILVYQIVLPENLNSKELFADNFETYPMILNQRTLDDTQTINKSIFNQTISDYQQGNFEAAEVGFNKLKEGQENEIAYQFYEGLSQLGAGNSGDAIMSFQNLLNKKDHLFIEQSRWYLVLSYLQNDDLVNTKKVLKEIMPGAYKYDEAQKIIKTINAIQKN